MLVCRCFDKLEHVEEFLSGKIRMMSLAYYRKKEDDSNGRKDKFEGAQKLWQGKYTTITIDGKEISSADGLKSLVIRSDDYEKHTKICCCIILAVSDRVENIDGLKKFNLPYTVLFSNPNEFVVRFRNAAKDNNGKTGAVKFFDESVHNGDLDAFSKPISFEWQNEFRLLLEADADDPFYLDIGDLHDIATVFETDKLICELEKAEIKSVSK